ncbi:MAG: phospholipase D-like domain-containing protein [Methanobrevibacter sp.]|jgi:hypothetical protein|nr:phospholipase D-like domain-containing protein [Candidatus Methanoflexus mossambicus]
MSTDSTFITNEEGNKLIDRFNTIIKDTVNFDVLVGYFYTSGFYKIYKSLEHTEKIRILVGITTDKNVYDLIQESNWKSNINVNEENINENNKNNLLISHKETKNGFSKEIKKEFDCSEDSYNVEEGANKFIEWLKSGKLEIKAYRDRNIHAKVYITTFHENDKDDGRVITGSSNFTSAGLQDNLEFNVELKNKADYEFALNKFNELWKDAVDVKEPYINTITSKTWLNDEITPYELFLKFLYEYLKDIINLDKEKFLNGDVPPNFMDLQYQRDAVFDGKRKIENHGGVFLSDVVGLGKTYMATMLAKQLGGRTLVIAPPNLLKKSNPGSWTNAAADFNFHLTTYSKGKLDQIIADGHEKFSNVIID